MNTETIPGARARARKRDNAARLGELQTAFTQLLNTTPGQITLLVAAAVGILLGSSIGR